MDHEPGLCDLVQAIDITLIALVELEADAHIVEVAFENAQRMAADLDEKRYADYERLIEKVAKAGFRAKVKADWDRAGNARSPSRRTGLCHTLDCTVFRHACRPRDASRDRYRRRQWPRNRL